MGGESEYLMHLLFFCAGSRATWCASSFLIRVEALPLDFTTALINLTDNLEDQQIVKFCNILWCIWKGRNGELFAGKKLQPIAVLRQAHNMTALVNCEQQQHFRVNSEQLQPLLITRQEIERDEIIVLIDGSWDSQNRAGIGVTVYTPVYGLTEVQYRSIQANDAFHAESLALWYALQQISGIIMRYTQLKITLYSDCSNLVEAIHNRNSVDIPSWKARETVGECVRWIQNAAAMVNLKDITREAVTIPHKLANMARRTGHEFRGTVQEGSACVAGISTEINRTFFLIREIEHAVQD